LFVGLLLIGNQKGSLLLLGCGNELGLALSAADLAASELIGYFALMVA
jgi:hypothetical protein